MLPYFFNHIGFPLGGNIWSSNSGSGEGNKSEAGLGAGTSGSNISDETGVNGTGTCDAGKDVIGSGSPDLRIEVYFC